MKFHNFFLVKALIYKEKTDL